MHLYLRAEVTGAGECGERSKKVAPSPAIAHSMGFSERVKEVKDKITSAV